MAQTVKESDDDRFILQQPAGKLYSYYQSMYLADSDKTGTRGNF